MTCRITTRVDGRWLRSFWVWALVWSLSMPSLVAAVGYDCNVHNDRQIYPAYDGSFLPTGTPNPGISLRDECFKALVTAPPEWPICQCVNSGLLVSDLNTNHYTDPMNPRCPDGYIELGRCVTADKYYVARNSSITPSTTNVHRSFVPNAEICEPCGHDVVSSVLGCKALCRRYFTNRFFQKTDPAQAPGGALGPGGSWRILHPDGANNPQSLPTLDNFYVCDVNDPTDPINDPINPQQCPATQADRQATGRPTAMEVCERRCGPPNKNNPASADWWDQQGDNWWYITYVRRDPNTILDWWIRSYNAVNDRPDPPGRECHQLVAQYCDYLDTTTGLTSGQKVQCKKDLVIRTPQILGENPQTIPDEPFVDYHGPTFDFTDIPFNRPFDVTQMQMNNDGFCDHLEHANNVCSQSCAQSGDSYDHAFRRCQTAGYLVNESSTVDLPPESGVCHGAATAFVRGRVRGGAVCQYPPPTDVDFSGINRGAKSNKVTLVVPSKEPACTSPRIAQNSATVHAVLYESPYAGAGENPSMVAMGEMSRATWRNLRNGAWGGIKWLNYGNLWVTDAPVPLVSGQRNTIVYTFTDRQLRTSGDAIEMIGP